jgi:hypothetical protein
MFLAEIAMYIFLLTFVLYLSFRVMWLVFFLFTFRFWEIVMFSVAGDFMLSLTSFQKFALLFIIAMVTYLAIFFSTLSFPIIRVIVLGLLFIFIIRKYSIMEILTFKDYFVATGMWDWDYWIGQIRAVFTFDTDKIFGLFDKVIGNVADFFTKIINALSNKNT